MCDSYNAVLTEDIDFCAGDLYLSARPGLGVELDARGNVARNDEYRSSVDGVYVCGDMGRGQSLIVWAIAEGRSCAAAVDRALSGESQLPVSIAASDVPIR